MDATFGLAASPPHRHVSQAPTENDWASSHRGGIGSIVKDFHAINTLARVRMLLTGNGCDGVPFRTNQARNLMLVTELFMTARRHIAAHMTEATLERFRGTKLTASAAQSNWKEAQGMLSAAGVIYCPVSGTPVMDLGTATDAVRSAIWGVLSAISSALSGRDGGVEAALNGLRDTMAVRVEV